MKSNNEGMIGDEFFIPINANYQDMYFTIIDKKEWMDHFIYEAICVEDENIQITIHSTDIELVQ